MPAKSKAAIEEFWDVVKDVTLENLVINGRVIRDSGGKPAWYLASDGVPMFVNDHVQGLRFLTTEEAAAL
ncbi:hypothetical protein [Streptomyces sp. 6N223]|uniref:hypothetical protein n=1 Tax=Streptomyces sp. 6N223 TaxID=3457412 RepID=UPI003FD057C2